MPTYKQTWGDTKALVRDKTINPIGDANARRAANDAFSAFTALIPMADSDVLVEFDYHTPDELAAAVATAVSAAVQNALRSVIGGFYRLMTQDITMRHVSGSVFYPVTLAGVNPVVKARIKIFRLDPAGLLNATLDALAMGAPLAEGRTDYQGRYYVDVDFKVGDALFIAKVSKRGRTAVLPLVFNAITAEFFPVIVPPDWLDAPVDVSGYRRKNMDIQMTSAERTALADAVFNLVPERLVRSHMQQIDHMEFFFIDHKTYIWQLEKKLLSDPVSKDVDCVPTPHWQPVNNIHGQENGLAGSFAQVLPLDDFDIWGVNGIINPLYNGAPQLLRPLIPEELKPDHLAEFKTAEQVAKYIGRSAASARGSFHFNAHAALLGPFGNMMTAAAANLFWPVHALMVDIYDAWVSRQFEKHNLQYQLGTRSRNLEHPENPRWHYLEIFTVTKKHEIWHCYQRDKVYERYDRPFDPVFDPADIRVCNPLDEDHNETDESWVHYSHWENRSVGWEWGMDGMAGMLEDAVDDHGKGTHDHAGDKSSGTKVIGELTQKGAIAHGIPGVTGRRAAAGVMEERPVTLIHCAAVSLKTTTDLVNGRVIVLAKDTNGKLCLLRPVLDDCGKCQTAKFTCHDLPFGRVADYDLCMKADGTLEVAYIEDNTGILNVRREDRYNSSNFHEVYRKGLSDRLRQVKIIKDANGLVHVFSSSLRPITDIPNPKKASLPTRSEACDDHGTLFHSFERSDAHWDTDPNPVSTECICSFTLELDARGGGNTIYVAGISCEDGLIYFTAVPGAPGAAGPYVWARIHNPAAAFFSICSVSDKDGTPEIFAIDSTGKVFRSKKAGGETWSAWMILSQQKIMGGAHRGIMAELDYTGCIKIFVHADDNFVYVCEQASPNSDNFVGWMNV